MWPHHTLSVSLQASDLLSPFPSVLREIIFVRSFTSRDWTDGERWTGNLLSFPHLLNFSISSGPSTSSGYTKKSGNQKKRKDAIDAALKALKEDDEFDGIGLNVACKLRRMDGDQKLYAEMLINKVLMHGVKGRLQEETDLLGLKFVQPQTPVRRVEKQIPCSFGQDENLFQTTKNFYPITGEGSTTNEYLVSADADSHNKLSELLLLK